MNQQTNKALPEIEIKDFQLSVKASGDGLVEGYGSVFGNTDFWNDIVAAGAFAKSLDEHRKAGSMPKMLWQHNSNEPIGVWTEMTEDANGLRVKGQIAINTTRGKDAYELAKMGALSGLSVGFITKQYEYDEEAGVRTILEADLWEVSMATFPANTKAQLVSVKSAGQLVVPKDAEKVLRDAGFSRKDATAFVSSVMRMGEERRDADDSTAAAMKAANRLLESMKL